MAFQDSSSIAGEIQGCPINWYPGLMCFLGEIITRWHRSKQQPSLKKNVYHVILIFLGHAFRIIVQLWGTHSLEQMEHSWSLNTQKHLHTRARSSMGLQTLPRRWLSAYPWNQLSQLNIDPVNLHTPECRTSTWRYIDNFNRRHEIWRGYDLATQYTRSYHLFALFMFLIRAVASDIIYLFAGVRVRKWSIPGRETSIHVCVCF